MVIKISLDTRQYNLKPQKGYEITAIKERAIENWLETELSEAADIIGNHGVGFVPAHLIGGLKTENFVEAQLIVMDFDGGISFEDVMSRCRSYGLPVSFAYETLNSTLENTRFRIVFTHECLITDAYIYKVILDMLTRIFPEADPACKNPDRLFLGGKKSLYIDDNAYLSLSQLIPPFYSSMTKNGHLKRDIDSFCKKHRILEVNNRPAMENGIYLSSVEIPNDVKDIVKIHIVPDTEDCDFFVIECPQRSLHISKKKKKRRIDDISNCYGCQLLDDFAAHEDIGHMGRFAVLTNLMQINGGAKYFYEILKDSGDTERYQKWCQAYTYLKGYNPQRCDDSFCPYYHDCTNLGTIFETISTDRSVHQKKETYVPLEEAEQQMKDNIEAAIATPGPGIHLIRAQTGLGKTTTYRNIVCEHVLGNPTEKFIIATPTLRLRKQVMNGMSPLISNEIAKTPSPSESMLPPEIKEQICSDHSMGFHNETHSLVKDYYETIKDDPNMPAVAKECEEILNGQKIISDKRVTFTTHAYLLTITADKLSNCTVIVDEDFLNLQIFNRISSISLGTLMDIKDKRIPQYSEIAEKILNTDDRLCGRLSPNPAIQPLTKEQIEEYGLKCDEVDDINDLRLAATFLKEESDSGEMIISYFCPTHLPKAKYIVLSATLDAEVYKAYFGDQMPIYEYPELKAPYKGKLIQYTYKSLGRRDLWQNTWVFDYARSKAGNTDIPIISFKCFENLAGSSGSGYHFGNTTGMNTLEGKDICVIGTPYMRESQYKLIAAYLGADVNNKDDVRPRYRRVEYNGNSFMLMSYKDKLLQRIQMYELYSELEQSVGRARLLRYDCNVYVFSSFPCEQAQLIMGIYNPNDDHLPKDDKK